MYLKKLIGFNTLSCNKGSIRLRPEWPWRARKQRISCPDGSVQSLKSFLVSSASCHAYSSTFHQTNVESAQNRSEDNSFNLQNSIAPSSSRGRSPWRRRVLSCFDTGEARSRPEIQGPQQEYAGYVSTTSWKLKVSGSKNSRVIGEMMKKERKWMEMSKRSGTTLTTDDTCACDMRWMQDNSPLECARNCVTDEDNTNNKAEGDYKANKLSCGSIHSAHESSVDVLLCFYMLQVIKHVAVLVALHFLSPIQLLSMLQLIHSSPVCEFLVDAHTAFIVRK